MISTFHYYFGETQPAAAIAVLPLNDLWADN